MLRFGSTTTYGLFAVKSINLKYDKNQTTTTPSTLVGEIYKSAPISMKFEIWHYIIAKSQNIKFESNRLEKNAPHIKKINDFDYN